MDSLWKVVQLWARNPSGAQSNSLEGFCHVLPAANTPGIWGNGCFGYWKATWAGHHSIYSEHPLHTQIHGLQILSSSHLETGPREFWLASFRGKLKRGRFKDDHPSAPALQVVSGPHWHSPFLSSTTPPSSPSSALLQVKVVYLVRQPRPSSLRGHQVHLGLWWLHLTFKIA